GETPGNELCKPGLLHAATEAGEALVSYTDAVLWPCRLFAVEPRSKLVVSADHPYKVGASAWKVVAELPAWQALGPNGMQVAAVIARCETLTYDERCRLHAAGDAPGVVAWDAGRVAAGVVAWDAGRAAAWVAARGGAARDAARHAAGVAARDAALALIVRDLISEADFDLLYGPWAQVIGDAS
ncbi:MAG: hypothetical protein ACYCU7_19340, partial [Acidimicrobiales bacterium]